MKIISEKTCEKLIDKNLTNISSVTKLPLWSYWTKIKPIICLVFVVVSFTLATVTLKRYKYAFMSLLGITSLNILWKSIIALICFVTIIITVVIMAFIHEMIHVLCYKIFKYQCVLVVNKHLTFSILSVNWVRKSHQLCTIILPFFVMLIIICLQLFLLRNVFLFLWLTLINLALSCSDILSFMIILLKTPNDTILFGHYFRRQQ